MFMAQKKATIIKVSDDKVSIGMEDGTFFDVSRKELDFTPKIGDDVSVFSSGDLVIVTKVDFVKEKVAHNEINNTDKPPYVQQDFSTPNADVVSQVPYSQNFEKKYDIEKIIYGIASVIALVLIILVYRECDGSSYRADEKKEMKREIQMYVSAGEILSAYNGNEIAADAKYKGKRVAITGCVEDFFRGGDAGIISFANKISLNSCSWFSNGSVDAYFRDERQLKKAAQLRKGNKVMVQCTITNGSDNSVEADFCTITK